MNVNNGKQSLWHRLFSAERPSLGLAFFRPFVALAVGAHMIPSLLYLDDNYLHTAFKEKNDSFFTPAVPDFAVTSPDWLVYVMVVFFCTFLTLFAIGLFSQLSCIFMVIGCYYFYALNSLHTGTLSFDILLVTLFLMCVTGYHGDFFSVDSIRKGDPFAYRRTRPFFVQRLLQLQLASTCFLTGLSKITIDGNWLTGNPIYYLVNSIPPVVVKSFPFRDFLAASPNLCYALGLGVIAFELALPFLLFIPRTRLYAVFSALFFHILLGMALHVPALFFFLFIPQLSLFINPENIVNAIDKQRVIHQKQGREKLIYDGHCSFCIMSMRKLLVLDPTGIVEPVDYQKIDDLSSLDPRLNKDLCHSQIHLLGTNGKLYGGFYAFRYLSFKLPLLWFFAPLLYFPGMQWIGSPIYNFIARNRYLFHRNATCRNNQCLLNDHKHP